MAKLLKIEEEKYRKIESSAQNNLLLNKDRGVPSEGGVKKLQTEAYIASTTVYVRKKIYIVKFKAKNPKQSTFLGFWAESRPEKFCSR